MGVPAVLRNRDFDLYWGGVVLSQIGTRGAVAANLYQVYELTGSTAQTGLVGLAQAVALVVLSPIGGVYADRLDRRRLLQAAQAVALVVSLALTIATFSGHASTGVVVVSALLATAAATFDQPARQALIPAMVPKERLVDAFALLNPSRELAILAGPALAGLMIAVGGPGVVYAFDAVTYAVLVAVLAMLHVPRLEPTGGHRSLLHSMREGVAYIRHRPVIWQLMGLDLSATVFGAYRVVLPAFAVDILHVGATGYGLLSAAPSAGALLGSALVFKLVRSSRSGHIVLAGTFVYGLFVVGLAQSRVFWLAIVMALGLGVADALATTVRHAAVQIETPDELRGRVSSIYQMSSRGGPALGDTTIGAVAGALGPIPALTLGGVVPAVVSAVAAVTSRTVRRFSVVEAEEAEAESPDARPTVPPPPVLTTPSTSAGSEAP